MDNKAKTYVPEEIGINEEQMAVFRKILKRGIYMELRMKLSIHTSGKAETYRTDVEDMELTGS